MVAMSKVSRRTGRRPGAVDTREQILTAARKEFAAKGFRGATTRSIADAAGVNVALLSHYFGSKAQLFEATLELIDELGAEMHEILAGDLPGAGERLTRTYLTPWEDLTTRGQLLAAVRTNLAGDEALHRIQDVLNAAIDDATADAHPERRTGLALAMSHLLGVAITRYVSCVAPITDMSFDEVVTRVAPAVQLHLTS